MSWIQSWATNTDSGRASCEPRDHFIRDRSIMVSCQLEKLRAHVWRNMTMSTNGPSTDVMKLLGDDAKSLLDHKAIFDKELLHLPGPDFVTRCWKDSDRNPQALRSLESIYSHGRLGGTGYLSILPVDQGIEHSGAASFSANPLYFDGENIVKLAIEGGCNAVATTFGVLGSVSRRYAHKIPFICKLNHNRAGIDR